MLTRLGTVASLNLSGNAVSLNRSSGRDPVGVRRPAVRSHVGLLCLTAILCAVRLSAVEPAEYETLLAEITPDRLATIEARSRIQVRPRHARRPSEPPVQILDARDRLILELGRDLVRQVTEPECDDEEFARRTGAALVSYIRATPYDCLNRLFQDAPGRIRFAAFRAQNMIDVATAMRPLAAAYDGTNADRLVEVALFLRVGYFNAFYDGQYLDWNGRAAEIDAAVAAAMDAFVDNTHFYGEAATHHEAPVGSRRVDGVLRPGALPAGREALAAAMGAPPPGAPA